MNDTGKKFSFGGLALLAIYVIITLILCEFKGSSSFWISFTYMCFSFVLVSGMSFFASERFQNLRDWIFSLPIIRWCVMYIGAEFVISLIFMIIPVGWKVSFIIQLLLLVVFAALVGPSITQRKYIEEVHDDTVKKVSFARELYAKLVTLLPRVEDPHLKASLSESIEALRHSDPMSHENLSELEITISSYVEKLGIQIKNGDVENAKNTCKELNFSIAERSQMARALKLSQY